MLSVHSYTGRAKGRSGDDPSRSRPLLRDAIVDSAKALNILATHAQILVRALYAFFVLHLVVASGLLIGIVLLWDPDTRAWLVYDGHSHAVGLAVMRSDAWRTFSRSAN